MSLAKCPGKDCQKRETCFRFTKPDSYWQPYSAFYQELVKGYECGWYIPNGIIPNEKSCVETKILKKGEN